MAINTVFTEVEMSLKKVESVKKEKGFKLPDLIIYGAIFLLVAALFIAVFATRNTDPFQGVQVFVNNTAVMYYDFDKGELKILAKDGSVQAPDGDTDSVFTVKVSAGEEGYNVIEIDRTARSVGIIEANCGTRDCVHTPSINNNNGIIFCSPHKLRIIPFNFEVEDDGGNILI